MTSASEHAARLRILKNCLGMLEHPDGDLVFDQSPELLTKVNEVVLAIRLNTPVTEDDCLKYGMAAATEMEVVKTAGVFKFAYKGSGQPVSLEYRDSTIPKTPKD